jgi:acetyl esterase
LRFHRPSTDPNLPVVIYLHGGGWVWGSLDTHDRLMRSYAAAGNCAVLGPDYALSPEAVFPQALEECAAVLRHVATHGAAMGLDPARIILGGDSAGGTLAAVTAIAARDAGWSLSMQLLFYPGTAGHQDTPSYKTFAHGFLLEQPHIDYFFGHYLRGPQDRNDWRFAPLDGVDATGHPRELDGVAPAWIGLAECDPLTDEGVWYADRLRMAGVAVDLEIYAGMVHGFIQFGRALVPALTAHTDAARALRQAFA